MTLAFKPVDWERLERVVLKAPDTLGIRDAVCGWVDAPEADPEHRDVVIPFEPVVGEIDPVKTWFENTDGTWTVSDPTMRQVEVDVDRDVLREWLFGLDDPDGIAIAKNI